MGRPITGETRKDVRLNLFFEPKKIEQIDDFRFQNRIASRAEAIRRLIELGLKGAVEKRIA
jgi:hypothetical protein